MGFNTTVVIYNDSLHDIENDPEFGKKLAQAVLEHGGGSKSVNVFARGVRDQGVSSSQAGVVVDSHHSDETALIAVGGNTAAVIHTQFGGSFLTKEGQDGILKEALESEWRKRK